MDCEYAPLACSTAFSSFCLGLCIEVTLNGSCRMGPTPGSPSRRFGLKNSLPPRLSRSPRYAVVEYLSSTGCKTCYFNVQRPTAVANNSYYPWITSSIMDGIKSMQSVDCVGQAYSLDSSLGGLDAKSVHTTVDKANET